MTGSVTVVEQLGLALPERKLTRGNSVIDHIYQVMSRGGWWSLPELESALKLRGKPASQTAISARIRELPKKLGACYRKRNRGGNLWEYSIAWEQA